MKKFQIIIIAVILVLSVGIFAIGQSKEIIPELYIPQHGGLTNSISVGYSATNSYNFDNMMIYKYVDNVDDRSKDIAKKFNIPENLSEKNKRTSLNNDDIIYTYNKNNGHWNIQFKKESKKEKINFSNDEAIKTAKDYLKKKELFDSNYSKIAVTETTYGKDPVPYEKMVSFDRVINNIPCMGQRIYVMVQNNNKVTNIVSNYKDIAEYKVANIINPYDAYLKFKDDSSKVDLVYDAYGDEKLKSATIDNVELLYMDDGKDINEQPYLQPVWRYTGIATTDSGAEKSFSILYSAINYDNPF